MKNYNKADRLVSGLQDTLKGIDAGTKQYSVEIYIDESATTRNGQKTSKVASILNSGYFNRGIIDYRFMHLTFTDKKLRRKVKRNIQKTVKEQIKRNLKKKGSKKRTMNQLKYASQKLGKELEVAVVTKILEIASMPVDRKRKNAPLIDTGSLVSSVKSRVKKRRRK